MLGNPERFEKYATAASREFPNFEIRFSGVLQAAGTLIIQSAQKDNYSGWVRSNLGNFGKEQREKKITDMPWPVQQNMDIKDTYDDDNDDYNFVYIKNHGFWDGIGREATGEIPVEDENGNWVYREETQSVLRNAAFKNYFYGINPQKVGPLYPIKEGCVVSPYLHLRYVLKKFFLMNKWFINRNDMLDPGFFGFSPLKNTMVYNNFNIVDMQVNTFPEYAYYWDPETNTMQQTEVGKITDVSWQLKAFNYADLLPKISAKDFLLGIQNSLNFIFFFRNDSRVDIINRNEILKGEAISIHKYLVGEFEPGEQKNVRLKFLPEYDKDDGMFGSGFEDLSDRWADYKDPVETKDELLAIADPEFGELRMVIQENKIYEWTWLVVDQENINRQEDQIDTIGWKFVSTGPQPFIYGTEPEEEEIKTSVSTLQTVPGFLGVYDFKVNQRGNLASMRSKYSNFSLRLFKPAFSLEDSLFWDGTTGLFEKHWKNWARFWKTRLPFEAEFDLPLNVLSFCADNIYSKFSTEKGEFVIEEMETTFGLNSIGTTRIKGYKV